MNLKTIFANANGINKKDILFMLEKKYNISSTNLIINNYNINLSVEQSEDINKILNNYPVEYILGECEFFGDRFAILPKVLIPRPETELLVEATIKCSNKNAKIIEIGGGSGCVSISIAKQMPLAKIIALDIFAPAIQNINKNIVLHGAGNVFGTLQNVKTFTKHKGVNFANADVLVSNPPYIKQSSFALMQKSVKNFESRQALIGKDNGLEIYKIILQKALKGKKRLTICFEIGFDIYHSLVNFIEAKYKGIFKIAETINDFNNVKRVIIIRKIR